MQLGPAGFGELLRRYRVAPGRTQEALAEKAGLSVRGLSDLERGLRQSPHPETVRRLVAALRLRRDDQLALAASTVSSVASDAVEPAPQPIPMARPESSSSVSPEGEHKVATLLCCQLNDTAMLADRLGADGLLAFTDHFFQEAESEIEPFEGHH